MSSLFTEFSKQNSSFLSDDHQSIPRELFLNAKGIQDRFRRLPQGSIVSVQGPNGVLQLRLMIAVMEAGYCCLPLSDKLPEAAYGRMISLVRPSLELTHDGKNFQTKSGTGIEAICPGAGVVFCSSGSTGEPKLIFQPIDNLRKNAIRAASDQGVTSDSVVLASLPLSHTGGLNMQVLPALVAGASIRFLSPGYSSLRLAKELTGVSHTILVPSQVRILKSRQSWFSGPQFEALTVLTGSCAVLKSDLEYLLQGVGRVVSVYGMTEAGPYLSVKWHYNTEDLADGLLGEPIAPYSLKIEAPSGEIVIEADTVGFLMDPASGILTSCAGADGILRSGDLGSIDSGGRLIFGGRTASIINVGGLKVSPAEIERLILKLPGVGDCAVLSEPHILLGEVPVAYVVAEGLTENQIFFDLRRQIEGYKLPRKIFLVPELPRTSIGKPDYGKLMRVKG